MDDVPGALLDAGGGGDDEVLDDDGALVVTWVLGFDEVAGAEVDAGAALVQLAVGAGVVCALAAGLAVGLELCAAGVTVLVTVVVTGGAVTVTASLGVEVPLVVSVAGGVL